MKRKRLPRLKVPKDAKLMLTCQSLPYVPTSTPESSWLPFRDRTRFVADPRLKDDK